MKHGSRQFVFSLYGDSQLYKEVAFSTYQECNCSQDIYSNRSLSYPHQYNLALDSGCHHADNIPNRFDNQNPSRSHPRIAEGGNEMQEVKHQKIPILEKSHLMGLESVLVAGWVLFHWLVALVAELGWVL